MKQSHASTTSSAGPRLKLPESAVCRKCGAVYLQGRWQNAESSDDAAVVLCEACRREEDNFPAGLMLLTGSYVAAHRAELVELIRNQEALERAEHPLNRIMSLEQPASDRIVIATTDIHLPHRIGEAVKQAYDGRLWRDFDKGSEFVRMEWRRELD